MAKKTYSVIHLYMGEVCRSENQSYKKVVSTLSHIRENQIKGWRTKEAFFESLEKFMKVAQPGESFMIGDLGAVVREPDQNNHIDLLLENNWELAEGDTALEDEEPDAYMEESIKQSVWLESGVLIGHDEMEDGPIMGDVIVVGDENCDEQVNVPLCLVRDLITRADKKKDPSNDE